MFGCCIHILINTYKYLILISCDVGRLPVANNDTLSNYCGRKSTSQEIFADMMTVMKRRNEDPKNNENP